MFSLFRKKETHTTAATASTNANSKPAEDSEAAASAAPVPGNNPNLNAEEGSRSDSAPRNITSMVTALINAGMSMVAGRSMSKNPPISTHNDKNLPTDELEDSSHVTNNQEERSPADTTSSPNVSGDDNPEWLTTSTPTERVRTNLNDSADNTSGNDKRQEWEEVPLIQKDASAPTHPRISPWLQVPPTILAITIAALIGYSQLPMKLQHPVKLDTIAHKACYTLILILAVLLLAANLGYIIHKHCAQPSAPGK